MRPCGCPLPCVALTSSMAAHLSAMCARAVPCRGRAWPVPAAGGRNDLSKTAVSPGRPGAAPAACLGHHPAALDSTAVPMQYLGETKGHLCDSSSRCRRRRRSAPGGRNDAP
uniref:Putative secreted protein n=1 Tax=Ixodes ricinus TaxID=34613 RepID=A0A6B0UJQ6_IXORI